MKPRFIFLDFDGVLNSAQWFKWLHESGANKTYASLLERHYSQLNPVSVKLMSDFAVEVGANIVVSSTWRILHSLEELRAMLKFHGMAESVLPISTTPITEKSFRGHEVSLWIRNNRGHTHPDYVIFDDDSDFFSDQPLVKTSWDEGLLEGHIDLARGIFSK